MSKKIVLIVGLLFSILLAAVSANAMLSPELTDPEYVKLYPLGVAMGFFNFFMCLIQLRE